jgi:hypothetical protein
MTKKNYYHNLNKKLEQEPSDVTTSVSVNTPKLEKAVFEPAVNLAENVADVVVETDSSHLKTLFSDLASLLANDAARIEEEQAELGEDTSVVPQKTDSLPANPSIISNPSVPDQANGGDPVVVPASVQPAPIEPDSQVQPPDEKDDDDESLTEAKRDLKKKSPKVTLVNKKKPVPPPPVATPAPTPAPVPVPEKPRKWVFEVVRNAQGLIDKVVATAG